MLLTFIVAQNDSGAPTRMPTAVVGAMDAVPEGRRAYHRQWFGVGRTQSGSPSPADRPALTVQRARTVRSPALFRHATDE
jgi:hypothetical protein